jgi:hypothetical protein
VLGECSEMFRNLCVDKSIKANAWLCPLWPSNPLLCILSVLQNKKQAQTLVFTDNQMDFRVNKQYHLRQLQQLKKKLLTLQQELEFRTQELQASYCSLLQYQSILEKQTSDLLVLHRHCKLKEDEVS